MKQRTKLTQDQQHAQAHHSEQQTGQEFASTEELVRHDAAEITVPPQIEQKLKRSIANALPQKTSWIKRFFK